jgi:hypothetical protein
MLEQESGEDLASTLSFQRKSDRNNKQEDEVLHEPAAVIVGRRKL